MLNPYAYMLECRPHKFGMSWIEMSVVCEKRVGLDRRQVAGRPPAGIRERRAHERRQTTISDIPFIEWAAHFAAFKRELPSSIPASSTTIQRGTAKDGGVE